MNPVELAASLLKSHDNEAVRAAAHAVIVADLDLKLFRDPDPHAEDTLPPSILGGGFARTWARMTRLETLKQPLLDKYEKAVATLREALAQVPA